MHQLTRRAPRLFHGYLEQSWVWFLNTIVLREDYKLEPTLRPASLGVAVAIRDEPQLKLPLKRVKCWEYVVEELDILPSVSEVNGIEMSGQLIVRYADVKKRPLERCESDRLKVRHLSL